MDKYKKAGPIYVASRASIPARSIMWKQLRIDGWQITSSWIDEAGEGETEDFTELWDRIMREIGAARKLVLYAEQDDFPLKGAILEAGIALGMGKPVIVCLPGVKLDGRTKRPIGSWLAHRNVIRVDFLPEAMSYHTFDFPISGGDLGDVYTDEDMALVGRSLMESLRVSCPKWSPADDPAEIVVDLLNVVHDLKGRLGEIKAMTPAHYTRMP